MFLDELHQLEDSELLQYFEKHPVGWVRCTIPVGKRERIVRCTRLKDADEKVDSISRLSYCPSYLLREGVYNRCNLPKQEMFYGTLFGEGDDEIKHALITSVFEVSDLCHETSNKDEYYVSGEWLATKDIKALVIFDHTQSAKSTIIQKAKQKAEQFLSAYPDRTIGDAALIEAFSKEVKNNSDYRITACYSDYLFNKCGVSAIVYPSVRTGKVGTCIAIRPSLVDSGDIKLIATSKYTFYLDSYKKINGKPYQHGYVDEITGHIRYERIL